MLEYLEKNLGYDIVLWFESWVTPLVENIFKPFDLFGSQFLYVALICLFYWSIDKQKGKAISVVFLFSCYINDLFKLIFSRPRPYQVIVPTKPQISCALEPLSSYGLPSGHTQSTTSFFLAASLWFKKNYLWAISILLILLVPLSRLIHRMHYPQDIVVGYLLAFIVVFAAYFARPLVVKGYKKFGKKIVMPALIIICGFIFLSAFLVRGETWRKETIFELATLFCVGLLGYIIEHYFIKFSSSGSLLKRIVRVILGLGVLVVLKIGMNFAFSPLKPQSQSEITSLYILFECIESMVLVLWITCGAPAFFIVTSLAYKEKSSLTFNGLK